LDKVTLTPVANPPGHATVYVSKVTDVRQFTADILDGSHPCLHNAADLSNKAVTDVTIGNFEVKSDVTLPGGATVESVVTEAIENGLKAKGYTVVAPGSGGVPNGGVPVEAEITQCWMWTSHGPYGLLMTTVGQVRLTSAVIAGGAPQIVNAEYHINSPFITLGVGLATVDDCMDALSQNMQPALKAP
jgi:hypothetical protein